MVKLNTEKQMYLFILGNMVIQCKCFREESGEKSQEQKIVHML